jgi:MFS superfamily sulfate permease-like transporter
MAYTIMIGVPPQYGVYTAGIGAVIYSILGTSMHASVGPCTTTFLMIAKAVENSLHHNYTIDEKVTAL